MKTKYCDEEIPKMIEECIDWASNKGRDESFFLSLQEWYEEHDFLTEKQYNCLCDWYVKVTF